MEEKYIRVVILGSRGIPAEFGGFETFAEQLSVRLVNKGIKVTVFCEKGQSYKGKTYKGVNLEYIWTPNIVGFRSIWFDMISIIKALRNSDIIYMLGYHVAFLFFIPKLVGKHFWVNMDGLEWKRAKWSKKVKLYLRIMERLAVKWSTIIIADAQGIAQYFEKQYALTTEVLTIPYGAELVDSTPNSVTINEYGLKQNGYYLVVCRLEPENHVHEILQGFKYSDTKKKLVIIGDYNHNNQYAKSLLEITDERILFLGAIYDQQKLITLRYHCYTYLHGHSVGGTNPSLLEAMACGNFIIAHDNIFNREVTQNSCWYFKSAKEITQMINLLESKGVPPNVSEILKSLIRRKYNWDHIAETYVNVIRKTLKSN